MTEPYEPDESTVAEEADRVEKFLLEACDIYTRSLLSTAMVSFWPCGDPPKPTLIISCQGREVAEAIASKHAFIKAVLKDKTSWDITIDLFYQVQEGTVHFDSSGITTSGQWFLLNQEVFGKLRIPLPIANDS